MSKYTTQEILELIERNGGPKGLDLSGKDLSSVDLGKETLAAELEKALEKAGIDKLWMLSDVPERKNDLVSGRYELPAPDGPTIVAVKIIDMLGEEVLVTAEV